MIKIKTILSIILVSFIISGCAKFITRLRVKPQLLYEDGLLISNSQTNPYRFKYENNQLRIDYALIIKNNVQEPKELDLTNAYYQANQEKSDLKCLFPKTNQTKKTLKFEEQALATCSVNITPSSLNALMLKDTDITLSIPLAHNIHNFTYRVFAEEFVQ
ncbi:MAG: hypothetical protein WC635_12315 [Bacteriovorax sp.]|jgi:hypothetical protein